MDGLFADEAAAVAEIEAGDGVNESSETSQSEEETVVLEPGEGSEEKPAEKGTEETENAEVIEGLSKPAEDQEVKKEGSVSEEKVAKPPEGYVEIQALKETRGKLKETKSTLDQIQTQNESLMLEVQRLRSQVQEVGNKEEEFKELTPEEIADLREEDPDAYVDYRFAVQDHKDKQRIKSENVARLRDVERQSLEVVNTAGTEIGEFLAEEGKVDALVNYGTDAGFNTSDLYALSQPQTKIVTYDGQERYLGKGAIAFLKLLDSSRTNTPETIKKQYEKELNKTLTERITKEVLGKIKTGSAHVSLDGQEEREIKTSFPDNLTEAQIARLSTAEREAWLKQ